MGFEIVRDEAKKALDELDDGTGMFTLCGNSAKNMMSGNSVMNISMNFSMNISGNSAISINQVKTPKKKQDTIEILETPDKKVYDISDSPEKEIIVIADTPEKTNQVESKRSKGYGNDKVVKITLYYDGKSRVDCNQVSNKDFTFSQSNFEEEKEEAYNWAKSEFEDFEKENKYDKAKTEKKKKLKLYYYKGHLNSNSEASAFFDCKFCDIGKSKNFHFKFE